MAAVTNLVSIIVPAYNAEKYIAETIKSVLQQTYPYFELIIVDDASQDRTAEIVSSFDDERVKLIRHTSNQGPGGARNTAIEAANGRWMAVLDADDQWLPERLEKLLQTAWEAGDGYFVADNSLLCFDTPSGLRPWGCQSSIHYKISFDSNGQIDIVFSNFLRLGAPVLKQLVPADHIWQFGLHYNPSCFFGEDLEFVCHLFRTGLKLRLIAEPLYLYRLTPGSLTSKPDKLEHLVRAYQRLINNLGFTFEERLLLEKQLQKIKADQDYASLPIALKQGKYGEALSLVIKKPALLLNFLRRLPSSAKYRLAAMKSGGNVGER